MSSIVCPIDSKDDSIQKVSFIVSSGHATGTFYGPSSGAVYIDGKWGIAGGYTTLSGSTATHLAQLLSPPAEPAKPKGYGCLSWLGIAIVTYWGAMVIAILIESVISSIIHPENPWYEQAFPVSLVLIGIGSWAWLLWAVRRGEKRKIARRTKKYQQEKPAWDMAIARWNRSYYCWKHDIVFDSESPNSTCQPPEFKSWLFS